MCLVEKTEVPQEKKKEPLKAMLPLLWVLITQQKVGKHGLNGKKIHQEVVSISYGGISILALDI